MFLQFSSDLRIMNELLTRAGSYPDGKMVNTGTSIPCKQISAWAEPADVSLPAALSPWLCEMSSLTRRLRSRFADFSLELLGCHEVVLSDPEQQWLGGGLGLCREVILHGGGQPCVYGWTLSPKYPDEPLSGLGSTPLGELVFAHSQAVRTHLAVARFAVADNPWSPAAILWGRRSLLRLAQTPLLVHELFLPGLPDAKESL